MSDFNPRDGVACLGEGVYDASVKSCYKATSKAGNQMVVVEFTVYDGAREVELKEFSTLAKPWKLNRLCKCLGAQAAYDSGSVEAVSKAVVGRNLKLHLEVESDDTYGDKNYVNKYESSTLASAAPAPAKARPAADAGKPLPPMDDSEIPF